jgi:predicted PhzF superfamily epimerase YddE/YHI9
MAPDVAAHALRLCGHATDSSRQAAASSIDSNNDILAIEDRHRILSVTASLRVGGREYVQRARKGQRATDAQHAHRNRGKCLVFRMSLSD